MKFSFFIMGTLNGSYQQIINQAILLDHSSFDTVWLAERHFQHGSLLWPSPLLIASYLAAKTQRLRIGLAASILPLHHPIRLAEEIATLDLLSNGRIKVGVARSSLDEMFHQVFKSPLIE